MTNWKLFKANRLKRDSNEAIKSLQFTEFHKQPSIHQRTLKTLRTVFLETMKQVFPLIETM